mgnify:CR=1 FL=1
MSDFKIGDEVYIKTTDYESENGLDYSEWIWKITEFNDEWVILECTDHDQEDDYFFESNDPKPNTLPFRVITDIEYVHRLKYPISLIESID